MELCNGIHQGLGERLVAAGLPIGLLETSRHGTRALVVHRKRLQDRRISEARAMTAQTVRQSGRLAVDVCVDGSWVEDRCADGDHQSVCPADPNPSKLSLCSCEVSLRHSHDASGEPRFAGYCVPTTPELRGWGALIIQKSIAYIAPGLGLHSIAYIDKKFM